VDDTSGGGWPLGGGASSQRTLSNQRAHKSLVGISLRAFHINIEEEGIVSKIGAVDKSIEVLWNTVLGKQGQAHFPKLQDIRSHFFFGAKTAGTNPNLPLLTTNFSSSLVVSGFPSSTMATRYTAGNAPVQSNGTPSPFVTLISSDDFEFHIRRSAACVSGTIRRMLDPQSMATNILRISRLPRVH
jgi:hypothetical protein